MAFEANSLFFYVPLKLNNQLIEVSELITLGQISVGFSTCAFQRILMFIS